MAPSSGRTVHSRAKGERRGIIRRACAAVPSQVGPLAWPGATGRPRIWVRPVHRTPVRTSSDVWTPVAVCCCQPRPLIRPGRSVLGGRAPSAPGARAGRCAPSPRARRHGRTLQAALDAAQRSLDRTAGNRHSPSRDPVDLALQLPVLFDQLVDHLVQAVDQFGPRCRGAARRSRRGRRARPAASSPRALSACFLSHGWILVRRSSAIRRAVYTGIL
jgi:hypothetical protein